MKGRSEIREKYSESPITSEDLKREEMRAIREKLSEMHIDIKKIIEYSSRLRLEAALEGSRHKYSNALLIHLFEDIETGLERNMVKKCPEKKNCTSAFTALLQQNAGLIKHGKVDDTLISENRKKLDELRCGAPFSKCEQCFSEVSSLFIKQVNLMRSMRIYSDNQEHKSDISAIKTGVIMSEILEPVSNNQRLEILRYVAFETKSFSAFSELTGLRGGNLLFHLQKLMDSGLILQQRERGDYMITEKGFKILQGLQEIYSSLQYAPLQNPAENVLQFTGKADTYCKYRPHYPQEYINYLVSYNNLTSDKTIADIGSGTGILTQQLLERNLMVIAVEPNDDMRSIAENRLNNNPNFVSINGTAENTGLLNKSIDLITVGQAFHWFDKIKFKNECMRILKPNSNVALVWNSRDSSSQLVIENAEICRNLCPLFRGFSGGIDNTPEVFDHLFRDGKYEYRTFRNDIEYNLDNFIGRNLSDSHAPKSTDPNYKEFVKILTELFMKYSKDEKIILPSITQSYIGKV